MASTQISLTTILNGRVTHRLESVKERVLIGRSADCDLRIDSADVSRMHAAIVAKSGRHFLEDLGSSNGTQLNGRPVRNAELHNGDIVQIGDYSLHVGILGATGAGDRARAQQREEQTLPTPPPALPTTR
ncbi:MAG TPA: FHA domain-containing protein [Planctomycetota bacterium]|jgi:pSer/pThr/pTyr-binding forkhead associated (FHA) protein|nr:FHA domain-containing protein [Planctomycetota bacterium]